MLKDVELNMQARIQVNRRPFQRDRFSMCFTCFILFFYIPSILIIIMNEFSHQGQSNKSTSYKYNPHEARGTGFPIEPPRGNFKKGYSQSKSVIHPNAVGYSWNKKTQDDSGHSVHARTLSSSQHRVELTRQESQVRQSIADSSDYHSKDVGRTLNNDSTVCSQDLVTFYLLYEIYHDLQV